MLPIAFVLVGVIIKVASHLKEVYDAAQQAKKTVDAVQGVVKGAQGVVSGVQQISKGVEKTAKNVQATRVALSQQPNSQCTQKGKGEGEEYDALVTPQQQGLQSKTQVVAQGRRARPT